jgi:hypothetical protein
MVQSGADEVKSTSAIMPNNMKPKQEPNISEHAKKRQESLKFLWHLCPPYLEKYDHSHWWRKTTPTQDAAMWEVLRRHPQAEKLLSHDQSLKANLLEYEVHIQRFGHLSWPEAVQSHNKFAKYWGKSLMALPPQWGVVKQGMFDVDLIQDHELKELGRKFNESLQRSQSPEKIDHDAIRRAYQIWNATSQTNVPVLNSNAGVFNVLFNGGVLVGFDPTKPGVVEMITKKVRGIVNEVIDNEKSGNVPMKSFWQDWLDQIFEFEHAVLSRLQMPDSKKRQIRNDKVFTPYRRIFKNRPWSS